MDFVHFNDGNWYKDIRYSSGQGDGDNNNNEKLRNDLIEGKELVQSINILDSLLDQTCDRINQSLQAWHLFIISQKPQLVLEDDYLIISSIY